MLDLPKNRLEDLGAFDTVNEINGQPELWKQVFNGYSKDRAEIDSFLNNITNKHGKIRVVFTGAGTSQYVGDVVLKNLIALGDKQKYIFDSIATTDIVSSPNTSLIKEEPSLVVSFARSGNSPESMAAIDIANNLIDNCFHLVITCANNGKLANKARQMENTYLYVLPDASNDKGFAMTGSCSSMMLLAMLVFSIENLDDKQKQVIAASNLSQNILDREVEIIQNLDDNISRIVYLGSGGLSALTREMQLKVLELTAGKISTMYDSSMGVRHGPKSFVNKETLVLIFSSNNEYTRKYDIDIYNEIKTDAIASKVLMIGQNIKDGFCYKDIELLNDEYLIFPALVFSHVIAINMSVLLNNRPDTPSITGTVNRVVKGVTIHSIEGE